MRKRLQECALIAEVISGLAVVITLVFLLVGIRDNTAINKALMYEELLSDLNQHNLTILQDPELSRIWATRTQDSINDLTEEELSRLTIMYRVQNRIFDAALFSYQYGFLGEDEWARFEGGICSIRRNMTDEMWELNQGPVSAEFVDYVNENC